MGELTITLTKDLNIVAIYAALVSTAVFIWQVVTYFREGARLRVRANSNMRQLGDPADKTFVMINAVNVGTADTTVTHIVLQAYEYPYQILLDWPTNAFIVNPMENQPIPCELKVGGQFMSLCEQNPELVRLSRSKYLYAGVIHSFSRRAVLSRVKAIHVKESPKRPAKGGSRRTV